MEWDWNPSLLSLALDYFPWTLCQEGKKVVGMGEKEGRDCVPAVFYCLRTSPPPWQPCGHASQTSSPLWEAPAAALTPTSASC